MWKDAVDVYEGGKACLFVPVHKKGQAEIENIWIFQVNPPALKYFIIDKTRVDEQNKWAFDYFTQEALKKKPKNGNRFKMDKSMSTRGWIENRHCAYEYHIGSEYEGRYDEIGVGWHCWSSWQYDSENPNMNEGGGGSGGGGCHNCMGDVPAPGGSGDSYTPSAPTPEIIEDESIAKHPEVKKYTIVL